MLNEQTWRQQQRETLPQHQEGDQKKAQIDARLRQQHAGDPHGVVAHGLRDGEDTNEVWSAPPDTRGVHRNEITLDLSQVELVSLVSTEEAEEGKCEHRAEAQPSVRFSELGAPVVQQLRILRDTSLQQAQHRHNGGDFERQSGTNVALHASSLKMRL